MATTFKNMLFSIGSLGTSFTAPANIYGCPVDSHAIINTFYTRNPSPSDTINVEVELTTTGRPNVASSAILFSVILGPEGENNFLTGPLILEGGDTLRFTANTGGKVEGTLTALQTNREDQETTPTGSV